MKQKTKNILARCVIGFWWACFFALWFFFFTYLLGVSAAVRIFFCIAMVWAALVTAGHSISWASKQLDK